MANEVKDKVIVLTGGVSGIGRAMLDTFLTEGARVVIGDIAADAGAELERAIGSSVRFHRTDVTVPTDIEALVARAVQDFGRLDVMVNNAGAVGEPTGLLDLDPEGFSRTMDLLLRSVVLGHTYAGRQIKAQGGGEALSPSRALPRFTEATRRRLMTPRSPRSSKWFVARRSNLLRTESVRTPSFPG